MRSFLSTLLVRTPCGRQDREWVITTGLLLMALACPTPILAASRAGFAIKAGRKVIEQDEQVQRQVDHRWRQDPRNVEAEHYVLETFGLPKSSWYVAGFPDSKIFFYVIPLQEKGLEEHHWVEVKEGVVRHDFLIVPDPDNKIGGILFLS